MGGYQCYCDNGYDLQSDGLNCLPSPDDEEYSTLTPDPSDPAHMPDVDANHGMPWSTSFTLDPSFEADTNFDDDSLTEAPEELSPDMAHGRENYLNQWDDLSPKRYQTAPTPTQKYNTGNEIDNEAKTAGREVNGGVGTETANRSDTGTGEREGSKMESTEDVSGAAEAGDGSADGKQKHDKSWLLVALLVPLSLSVLNLRLKMVDSQYYLPNDIGISALDCGEAFRLLSPRRRCMPTTCHVLPVLLQTSPESANIFVLLQRIFRKQTPSQLAQVATAAGLNSEEYQAFLVYAAGLYANMGNYKSFGDTKFIPNLPKDKLKALVWASQAFQEQSAEMEALWDTCSCLLYSLEDRQKQLGLGDKGITTYFSGNCCLEDAELAQKFLDSKKLSAYNTRLLRGTMEGKPVMRCAWPQLCRKTYTANENQRKMLEEYSRSFTLGSVEAHKEGSRYWIKDKGPIVESYIGFIESYRDPFGSRGEFE
ncbi:hypothetical protein INR49_008828, partial [Caranx melampygus]